MRKYKVPTSLSSTITLNNEINMPAFGFGTYKLISDEAVEATKFAIERGYRLIDTAAFYHNEVEIGEAVRTCGLSREEIFLTTKLWNTSHGRTKAKKAFKESLRRLKLDYVDLYLIHWPKPGKRVETWKTLEEIYKDGKARSIGVSNFTIEHLEELRDRADIIPAVNQFEFSPFLYQKKLFDYCRSHEIAVQAYAPITRANKFSNPTVQKMVKKYDKTPAQILLRWSIQHGAIPIPKSSKQEHIEENSTIFDFEIADSDMEELNSLDEGYRITVWDPTTDRWK